MGPVGFGTSRILGPVGFGINRILGAVGFGTSRNWSQQDSESVGLGPVDPRVRTRPQTRRAGVEGHNPEVETKITP